MAAYGPFSFPHGYLTVHIAARQVQTVTGHVVPNLRFRPAPCCEALEPWAHPADSTPRLHASLPNGKDLVSTVGSPRRQHRDPSAGNGPTTSCLRNSCRRNNNDNNKSPRHARARSRNALMNGNSTSLRRNRNHCARLRLGVFRSASHWPASACRDDATMAECRTRSPCSSPD